MAREWSRRSIEEIARKIAGKITTAGGAYRSVTSPELSENINIMSHWGIRPQDKPIYYMDGDTRKIYLRTGIQIADWTNGFVIDSESACLGLLPKITIATEPHIYKGLEVDSDLPYDVYIVVRNGGILPGNIILTESDIAQLIADGKPVYNLTQDYLASELRWNIYTTMATITLGGNSMSGRVGYLRLTGSLAPTVFNTVKTYVDSHYGNKAWLVMVERGV